MTWSYLTTNYNKADTLRESIPSMLDSLPEDGELIVVDGESTDGSIEVVRDLAAEDDRLELIVEDSNLGEGRQIAMDHASGDHVVEHLDTDRLYGDLTEYHDLYEALSEEHDDLFLMTLDSVYVTTPEVSAKMGGWPPISRAEERVYTDRAFRADDVTPRLYPKSVSEELPSDDVSTLPRRMRKWKYEVRDNVRCGFSLGQIIRYHHHEFSLPKALVADGIAAAGWWSARGMDEYGRNRSSWREFPSWEFGVDPGSDVVLDGPDRFGWEA
ncbi:hypothetical protein BRD17_02075 [Halobacteriales archaeon SW_7_68_16]|nr:MAG: hypothetical protein BRD17_02075 [Halobacteriales archaeon SW_7_68_16]